MVFSSSRASALSHKTLASNILFTKYSDEIKNVAVTFDIFAGVGQNGFLGSQ